MKLYLKNTTSLIISVSLLLLITSFVTVDKGGKQVENDVYKGAWRLENKEQETIKIISDEHFSFATYDLKSKKFIGAGGGIWTVDKNTYTETLEYYTADSSKVGSSIVYNSKLKGKGWKLTVSTPGLTLNESWRKIDESADSPLAGTWRITERVTPQGEKVTIPKGARKTLKYLSGKYFQWAAINPETKEFFGTGGGTYTLENGKYTEKINFFSRDSTRVGLTLTFDCEVNGNQWHHTGKSSTGNRVDEIWTKED